MILPISNFPFTGKKHYIFYFSLQIIKLSAGDLQIFLKPMESFRELYKISR